LIGKLVAEISQDSKALLEVSRIKQTIKRKEPRFHHEQSLGLPVSLAPSAARDDSVKRELADQGG
jgi:hypothetical protein